MFPMKIDGLEELAGGLKIKSTEIMFGCITAIVEA
jgi:hypothetical protein